MFRSFRFLIASVFGLLCLAVAAALSFGVGSMVADHLTQQQGQAMQALARNTGTVLAEGMHERMREVELIATWSEFQRGIQADNMRVVLERMQHTREHYAWIGVADAQGTVRAATRRMLEGKSVAERTWFMRALQGSYTGDVHPAKLLAKMLPPAANGDPIRFVDFAVPLKDASGTIFAVLGVHGSWDWANDVVQTLLPHDAPSRGMEVFILTRDGSMVYPREAPLGALLAHGQHWPNSVGQVTGADGKRYLAATAPVVPHSATTDLGWTVVVRQPLELAQAGAREAREVVLWSGVAGTVCFVVLGWVVAGLFSRPLQAIARMARRIESGDETVRMRVFAQSSELQDLSEALCGMTDKLVERERALEMANETLDARVKARTAELERANAALQTLSRMDVLTGLFNRRAAEERLREETVRSRRSGQPVAVVLADVDRFKQVNDTHGHATGDEVLKRVAQCLSEVCRGSDFVARFGGEEFLLLLPDTDPIGAVSLAEKVRQAVEALEIPVVNRVTISMGVAMLEGEMRQALGQADAALYAAKGAGRNRVMRFGDVAQAESVLEG